METHESTKQAATEHTRETFGEEDHKSVAEAGEGVDVAAKMAELQVRDIKQPRKARSKRPEHVLPNAAFTFEPSMPFRDVGTNKAARMPELQADNTKQQPEMAPERSGDMLPAFTFKLPIHLQGLMSKSHTSMPGGIDMPAKMAGLRAHLDKHPPKPVPQHPEHVVPTGTFTFASAIRKPEMRPVKILKKRKDIDVAAKLAALQLGDVKQPPTERPEYVFPNAAFKFTAGTQSHEPGSTPEAKSAATRPTNAQDAASKTLPVRQQHGLPIASFSFTTRIRVAGSGSVPGVEAGLTLPTDAQQITKTLAARALDQTDLVTESGSQTSASEHSEARPRKFCGILLHFALRRIYKRDPSEGMGPIYDFTDPPREATFLDFLSGEFWQVLDQCCEANAACKILETEIHGLQLEWEEKYHKHVENEIEKSLTRGSQEDTVKVDVQPITWPEDLFNPARSGIRRQVELEKLIEKARSECSKHEAKLSLIAWDLMVQRGFIPASVVARAS